MCTLIKYQRELNMVSGGKKHVFCELHLGRYGMYESCLHVYKIFELTAVLMSVEAILKIAELEVGLCSS